MLLRVEEAARRIGGRTLFEGVSFEVRPRDRIGLVGPNGAGKSTLLRLIAGDDPADEGEVRRPRGTRVGMLRQEIDPSRSHSVHEETLTALAHLDRLAAEMRRLEETMAAAGDAIPDDVAERYHRASTAFEQGGGFEREARVDAVLEGLGFDEAARARPLSTFSGGWLMRVELAKLLLVAPDVLLLDEPTNHLDLPSIQWFEETLTDFPGAVLTVSHDRTFLRRHVDRVVELDGTGRCTVYEGNYDRYLVEREERRRQLEARKANQDRQVADMERFITRFRAKATKARQVQSRIKALEKMERIELEPEARRRMRMRIPEPPRAGAVVMRLEGVDKAYDGKPVYRGIDFELQRGERVALVGPNGAGKSTLLRIAAGAIGFDAGARVPGHNVQVGFYAQHQLESLDASRTVLDELAAGAGVGDVPRLRGHLGAFLFSGDDVEKRVSVLSGGEKARLALAKMLLHPRNLLVLDEPTNHLDIAACEVLETALEQYAGTLLFVSHDRAFIDALATRVVEVDAGRLENHLGNYADYLRRTAAPEPVSAPAPGPAAEPVAEGDPAPARRAPATKAERQQERERRKGRDRVARQLARLEEEIAEADGEIDALGHRLADPAIATDAEKLQALHAEREALQARNEGRYAEWERLELELQAFDDVLG